MKIGGLLKTSLIDYPGKIAAVIFTQGCNFRCFYCHNPELVYSEQFASPIPEEVIMDFLERRVGMLEGISITGGEPLMQPDIAEFTEKLVRMGFLVKVDTNGSFPDTLKKLIDSGNVHYIAMDIKAPEYMYDEITGVKIDFWKIRRSIEIIKNSGVEYEFRTTYVNQLCTPEAISGIKRLVEGSRNYYIQKSNHPDSCNGKLQDFIRIKESIKEVVQHCEIR